MPVYVEGKHLKLNVKKKAAIGLISLIFISATTGYAISQSLIQKMFTGSVTISTVGDLELLDASGATLGDVSFGTLEPEEESLTTIKIVNTGNTALDVSGNRVDQNSEITVEYRNQDGTIFSGSSLKNLSPGDEVVIVIAIWSTETAVGTFQIQILFEAVEIA